MARRLTTARRRRRQPNWAHSTALIVTYSISFAAALFHLSNGTASTTIADLHPEKSLDFQKFPCGQTQLYHVHDLDPDKVYDLKISYPASLPTVFTVDVQQLLLTPTTTTSHGDLVRKVPRRMLNTEKLRLLPQELLRKWNPYPIHDSTGDDELLHRDERFRFDDLPGGDGSSSKPPLKQGEFIVEIAVRGDVEGISPVHAPAQRTCVYNIVVEEILLEAFPRDTLVLIAWLVGLLAVTMRLVYPFVLSLIRLDQPADQAITANNNAHGEQAPVMVHTKTC